MLVFKLLSETIYISLNSLSPSVTHWGLVQGKVYLCMFLVSSYVLKLVCEEQLFGDENIDCSTKSCNGNCFMVIGLTERVVRVQQPSVRLLHLKVAALLSPVGT